MTTSSVIASRHRIVMFIDGEPSLRKNVTSHLSELGLEVVAVGDGDGALAALRERRPDIVCIDVNLPRMSGYEVCEQIRSDPQLAGLPVLMTCDRASPEARAHSYEAGADVHLGKPYSLARLAKEVLRLLERAPDNEAEYWLKLA
jgi:DNA-binding response OmpR family regulator